MPLTVRGKPLIFTGSNMKIETKVDILDLKKSCIYNADRLAVKFFFGYSILKRFDIILAENNLKQTKIEKN